MTHAAAGSRYVMIGGFLGAGKTTAIAHVARALTDRGLRVGLITNDQSTGLVDTAWLRSRGFAVEEIAGGCFCCRFPSLQEAAESLDRQTRPDVFLAEPVGSCTDLLATVSYPLRRIYGDRFAVAPLSVLVDPARAARVLGLEAGRGFSPKVVYVYEKQLEEAELIVVNKCDALDPARREALVETLRARFTGAEVLCISAREGTGCEEWIARLLAAESRDRATMELDYDDYAEGEACLGWLNTTWRVRGARPFDGNALLVRLTDGIRARVAAAGGEIAHLKMTLDGGGPLGLLSVVSVVSSDGEPDLRESLLEAVDGGTLIINLRAELDPAALAEIVELERGALAAAGDGLEVVHEHAEHFRPARPRPTHRVRIAEGAAEGGTP